MWRYFKELYCTLSRAGCGGEYLGRRKMK